MNGYEEFSEDVKKVLSDVINRYSLNAVEETDHKVIFKSNQCFLLISSEYYYCEVYFKEKEADRWMSIGPYLSALYPDAQIIFTHSSEKPIKESIRASLNDIDSILQKYGNPFLTGDFSWREEYEKHL